MIDSKSSGTVIGTSLLSAIAASLCCITPLLVLFAGSSSIASNFLWIEPARPYLIALSIAVLAFAWYQKLKPVKTNTMDCNCETKTVSFFQTKTFLSIVTIFAALMMAFPLYAKMFYPSPQVNGITSITADNKQQVKFMIEGMTCTGCEVTVNNELSKVKGVIAYNTSYSTKRSLVTFDKTKVDVKTIEAAILKTGYNVKSHDVMTPHNSTAVSFYEAPLVCHAAPTIGCGSKAKFMLVDLEKYTDAVEGAWLNKKGTVVAVKWKASINQSRQAEIIQTVSDNHSIELATLSSTETGNLAKSFPNSKEWFKSKEVDKLSKEEAQIIAKRTIDGYKKDGLVKPSFEKQFQTDIAKIYEKLFLSISSYKDLTTEAYNKVEAQIQKAGEKYVGKGKMPRVELCISEEEKCEKDKSCSEGKTCCEQE